MTCPAINIQITALIDSFGFDNCLFERNRNAVGAGGSIQLVGKNLFLYVLQSTFYKCTSDGIGGAIYFNSNSSIIEKICVIECRSKLYHHFCHINCIDGFENNTSYISLSRSPYTGSDGIQTMHVQGGKLYFHNSNLTYSYCQATPSIAINQPDPLEAKFNTIMSNYASENRIIEIKGPGLRNNLQFFNIINNTQKMNINGIVYLTSGSNFTFSNSIF